MYAAFGRVAVHKALHRHVLSLQDTSSEQHHHIPTSNDGVSFGCFIACSNLVQIQFVGNQHREADRVSLSAFHDGIRLVGFRYLGPSYRAKAGYNIIKVLLPKEESATDFDSTFLGPHRNTISIASVPIE